MRQTPFDTIMESNMALLKATKDVVPMPTRRTVDAIEDEIADIARTVKPFGGSRDMERAKELLSAGLTAAYKDGASALQHALEEAEKERAELKLKMQQLDEKMDALKRSTAENIMQLNSKSSDLLALVESRLEHVTNMVRWNEDQSVALKQPFMPPAPRAPNAEIPAELDEAIEMVAGPRVD